MTGMNLSMKLCLDRLLSRPRRFVAIVCGVAVLWLAVVHVLGAREPDPAGGPPMMRRLTAAQYRNSIAQVFADDIPVTARFERPVRSEDLVAVGTGSAGISPFALEQYEAAAQGIAASVLDKKNRGRFVHCQPGATGRFDRRCAMTFLAQKGRQLFRRPLSDDELARYVALAQDVQSRLHDFHAGLEFSLYTMLVSPDFLFRIEHVKPGPSGRLGELDSYSKATRLSFFLSDGPPDDELLRAAQAGELDQRGGLARQVERLMKGPGFERAVRAFFADMLQFDAFADLSKDPGIYPAFNSEVAADAQEQTLRTIVEHLVEKDADYRDLFTTRDTFLTRSLGTIYRTPVPARGEWTPVSFTPDANRAGIQSHVSFLALHAHPGRSSPTLRGYAARQVFLCQHVPDPPANVNFAALEAATHKKMVTARDRLVMHATEPSCAGCHKVMDPLGLTMEIYDGLGASRTHENGARIDTSGSLDGVNFNTADDLAKALHDHPETPRCVAERLYTSAVGRGITWDERYYLDWLIRAFRSDDYRFPELMRRIALSRNFFAVTRPVSTGAGALVSRKVRDGGQT